MPRLLYCLALAAPVLTACATAPVADAPFDQSSLPAAVQVPVGHRVVLQTVGKGEIAYECRAKADAPDAFEWVFVGPQAKLESRQGADLGRYFGPPATWAAADGSVITGSQVAVAAAMPGSIPLQLVKANAATGNPGAMTGVTHIQRVATQGGVPPALPCDARSTGRSEKVKYQADYVFWKPV